MVRVRWVATLALLLMGLAVVTGVSAGPAGASTAASHTIASAGPLTVGDTESGGGGQVDFWKVTLAGGDKVGFRVSYPSGNSYDLGLYAPGTDDLNFLSSASFSHVELNGAASAAVLQAPYNGTFILAVCENAYLSSCSSGDSTNPVAPYTFTTSFVGGAVSRTVASAETMANPTITGARTMGVGHFEAGGANAVDFWRVHLTGGERLHLVAHSPVSNTYVFSLYKPTVNDFNFSQATPVATEATNSASEKTFLTLQAPYSGKFVLAVCENAYLNSCSSGDSTNPMYPYAFTTTETGGQSRTYLSLSAHTIRYHHERGLKFHVQVVSADGGMPAGSVRVSDGTKTVCTVRLVRGSGTCSPSADTKIGIGNYWIRAYYHGGNRHNSVSGRTRLTVTH